MKLTKEMCNLIAELEFQIGKECYNPKSYDGWKNIEGRNFRYPINVPNENGGITKIRGGKITRSYYMAMSGNLTPNAIQFMRYKFGSNELYVGQGLINVLEYLENRYGLNFEELEKHVSDI